MIKKVFWEAVAENWSKKETIEIPDVLAGDVIPDDFFADSDESAELDDWMKELLNPEELDLTDFWG